MCHLCPRTLGLYWLLLNFLFILLSAAGKQSEPVVPTAAVEEQVEQSTVLKQEAKFQSSEPADSQPAGDGVNEVEGVVASLSGVSRFEAEETSQEPLLGSSASEGTAISETGGSQPTEEDNAQLTTSVGSAVQETNNADVVNVVRTANNGESFSGAPEITVSSSADVRSAESDDKPTDDELSISTMQDQTIEQTADSELAISSPPDRKMENRDGEELSTSPLPQDKKIESGDDDGLFFTDARSEVSEYDVDVDADQKQSPEVRNLSVVDIQVQEVESGQKKSTADVQEETDVGEFVDSSSIPPAILASTAKPKSK